LSSTYQRCLCARRGANKRMGCVLADGVAYQGGGSSSHFSFFALLFSLSFCVRLLRRIMYPREQRLRVCLCVCLSVCLSVCLRHKIVHLNRILSPNFVTSTITFLTPTMPIITLNRDTTQTCLLWQYPSITFSNNKLSYINNQV
jgi:hypothetical protein